MLEAYMTYEIGQRVSRGYKGLGTIVDVASDRSNGYIVQMDSDEPGAVIMVGGYLLSPA